MALVDYFLKIEGAPGESNDKTHKDEIQVLSFSFGEALPFPDDGQQRALTPVDQARLLREPAVDRVENQPRRRRLLDDRALLRRERRESAEIVGQLRAPRGQRFADARSPVDGAATEGPNGPLQRERTVLAVRPRRVGPGGGGHHAVETAPHSLRTGPHARSNGAGLGHDVG